MGDCITFLTNCKIELNDILAFANYVNYSQNLRQIILIKVIGTFFFIDSSISHINRFLFLEEDLAKPNL